MTNQEMTQKVLALVPGNKTFKLSDLATFIHNSYPDAITVEQAKTALQDLAKSKKYIVRQGKGLYSLKGRRVG